MKNVKEFISSIITEASLDARIQNGIVDLSKLEHLQVVAEAMYEACQDELIVNEFVSEFLNEGKYPDRQAFNKDGWLVTFPSKDYRDAALKKGTHSISDPTHGKGGMNLYYKKKGKQKRQIQQQTTQVSSKAATPPAPKAPTATKAPEKTPAKTQSKPGEITPEMMGDEDVPSTEKAPAEKIASPAPVKTPEAPVQTTSPSDKTEPEAVKPAEAPAIEVPVVEKPTDQYANLSKKFAGQKGWKEEPYGEWRNSEGETMAVVGLTGEVVPVKSVFRDEYKLFAEKNMM